jgi:hypothetical protein
VGRGATFRFTLGSKSTLRDGWRGLRN